MGIGTSILLGYFIPHLLTAGFVEANFEVAFVVRGTTRALAEDSRSI